jgi:hypothetical protein
MPKRGIVADIRPELRELRQKRPQLAQSISKPLPEFAAITRLTGVVMTGGERMRYLVKALFGKSDTHATELDSFMRRLDRIAAERSRPVTRRASA